MSVPAGIMTPSASVTSANRNKPNPPQTRLQERQYEITVPNTGDRVAQTAAAMLLEQKLEPVFHRGQLRVPSWAQRP